MANAKATTKSKTTTKKSAASTAKNDVAKSTKKLVASGAKKSKGGSNNNKNSASTAVKAKGKKSKGGLIIGLIVAAIIAIAGIAVALFCLNKPDASDPTAKLDYSNAFFIYDNGEYSLWNKNGQRLSEDTFRIQSSFVGGYAMVKKDNQYGIISDSGRMSVDYGKYGSIEAKGGLYLAEDGNTKEKYLITGSGRVLEKGEEIDVDSPSSTSGFAVAIANGKVRVYNYAGTLIIETEYLGDDKDEPDTNSMSEYGMMHYGDKNWVFDTRAGNVVATFDGPRFTFDSVSDDRTMVLLEDYENSEKYKLIANGKLYDLEETKYYGMTDLNNVIGYDNFEEMALLDKDYKVAKRVDPYIQLKDIDNYVTRNEDGGVEIYHNGQKVKEFGEEANVPISGLLYNDYYAIEEEQGKIRFYSLDGTPLFDKTFNAVAVLSDMNNNSVVSETEDEFYVMNKKGEKTSDVVAKRITPTEGGYSAKNSDGKYAVLKKDGKPATDFKYKDVSYRNIAEPNHIWVGFLDEEKADVIDVDRNKVIIENVALEGFYTHYFTVKNDNGDIEYYTLDGKLFYTKEKEKK